MDDAEIMRQAHAIGLNPRHVQNFKNALQADLDSMGAFEFSLLLIKHFAVGHRDEIVKVIQEKGLRVVATESVVFSRMEAVRFAIIRAQAKSGPLNIREHAASLESLVEGAALAVIVAGIEAVSKLSALLGPDDPLEARKSDPESLRALFGGDRLVENGLHCSVTTKEAHEELSLIFPNYIDLVKTHGLTSQVDQWLWSLWRADSESSLFSSRLLDIRYLKRPGPDRRSDVRELFKFVRDKISGLVTNLTAQLPTASKSIELDLVIPPELATSEAPPLSTDASVTDLNLTDATISSTAFQEPTTHVSPEAHHPGVVEPIPITPRVSLVSDNQWPALIIDLGQEDQSSNPDAGWTEYDDYSAKAPAPAGNELPRLPEIPAPTFVRRRIPDVTRKTAATTRTYTTSHYDMPTTTPGDFGATSHVDFYQGHAEMHSMETLTEVLNSEAQESAEHEEMGRSGKRPLSAKGHKSESLFGEHDSLTEFTHHG